MNPRFRTIINTVVVFLSAALIGCGKSPAKTDGAKKTGDQKTVAGDGKKSAKQDGDKKSTVKLKPFEPPKTVALKDVTPKDLREFVEKQKGKVVLVDYWFVDCAPCRIAFPHTVEMSTKHAKDGLVVVTMCVDEFENRARAEKFLKSVDGKMVNFFASGKLDPEKFGELFDVEAFPTYRLYGADGKFIGKFFAGEELDVAVKSALGSQ